MKKLLLILLLMSSCTFVEADAETEFKIITLQHMFASDLLPIIAPMVGADGTANGMSNQLIVRANSERMREIEATVASLDVARVNRKITVKSSNNVQTQQERTEATGAIKVGKVTVANDRRATPNNGRVEVERNSSDFVPINSFINLNVTAGNGHPLLRKWHNLSNFNKGTFAI